MTESIKVNRTISKTITAASAAALDTAFATFVQTLGEAQLVSVLHSSFSGSFTIVIIYIPG